MIPFAIATGNRASLGGRVPQVALQSLTIRSGCLSLALSLDPLFLRASRLPDLHLACASRLSSCALPRAFRFRLRQPASGFPSRSRLPGSACRTLTTAQLRRVHLLWCSCLCASLQFHSFVSSAASPLFALQLVSLKSSPRPISTAKLHALLRFHRRPINPVVYRGPYLFLVGTLFLRGASRLDAFSVYPFRTSLPCYAVGTTTVAPVVRPLRSSRTRSSSSHDSYAHDG